MTIEIKCLTSEKTEDNNVKLEEIEMQMSILNRISESRNTEIAATKTEHNTMNFDRGRGRRCLRWKHNARGSTLLSGAVAAEFVGLGAKDHRERI